MVCLFSAKKVLESSQNIELQSALRLLQPEELTDREEAHQHLLREKWKMYFYENGQYVCVCVCVCMCACVGVYNMLCVC